MKKLTSFIAAAAVTVAALPIAACTPDSGEGVSSYEIAVSYDCDGRALSGTCGFTFYNDTNNEINSLSFNLWGNAYRQGAAYAPVSDGDAKAYWSGASYGGESVEKVEGCASWEIAGEDENILKVVLNAPVYPEETATVVITYTLNLAKINHRTGVTASTVNLGNFYPVLCAYTSEGFLETPYYSTGDPFVSACANYDVTLTLPVGYAAATSGKELSRTETDSGVSVRYGLENARDFAAVLSDGFKTLSAHPDGCDITVYYCGGEEPQKELTAVVESYEYFCSVFGGYEYPTLSVVMTPLNVSGMEYPALAMVNSALSEDDAVYTAVHENAHQWWYAMVGNNQVTCAWQDEGLAEYSALCFFETHPAYGYTRTGMLGTAIKAYRGYYSVYNQIFGKSDTAMTRALCDFEGDYEYVNIAYNKSLLMFESVRTAMGDKRFFAALADYFENNKFKIAPPEELIARFDALYDVEGLMDGYIEGKAII